MSSKSSWAEQLRELKQENTELFGTVLEMGQMMDDQPAQDFELKAGLHTLRYEHSTQRFWMCAGPSEGFHQTAGSTKDEFYKAFFEWHDRWGKQLHDLEQEDSDLCASVVKMAHMMNNEPDGDIELRTDSHTLKYEYESGHFLMRAGLTGRYRKTAGSTKDEFLRSFFEWHEGRKKDATSGDTAVSGSSSAAVSGKRDRNARPTHNEGWKLSKKADGSYTGVYPCPGGKFRAQFAHKSATVRVEENCKYDDEVSAATARAKAIHAAKETEGAGRDDDDDDDDDDDPPGADDLDDESIPSAGGKAPLSASKALLQSSKSTKPSAAAPAKPAAAAPAKPAAPPPVPSNPSATHATYQMDPQARTYQTTTEKMKQALEWKKSTAQTTHNGNLRTQAGLYVVQNHYMPNSENIDAFNALVDQQFGKLLAADPHPDLTDSDQLASDIDSRERKIQRYHELIAEFVRQNAQDTLSAPSAGASASAAASASASAAASASAPGGQ